MSVNSFSLLPTCPENGAQFFRRNFYMVNLIVLSSIFMIWTFNSCFLEFLNSRRQYLSSAVIQAKSATEADGITGSARGSLDSGLLDLLEGKLAVIQFQIKIKEELEAMASRLEASSSTVNSVSNDSQQEQRSSPDANLIHIIFEKAKELSLDLKSITQLYNDYAVPFELWEVHLINFFLLLLPHQPKTHEST